MSRHLLIAGTGRAGTSFLVRYLAALGLETHLSRAGAGALWDTVANAGYEDTPLPGADDLPYVIKSPWTFQVIHEALRSGKLQFDAVVIPMRDLTEAACSRGIIEMQAMHRTLPWMADLEQTWDHFGHTPGGTVFSLSPVDQARLLAVGFHQLLEHLVRAEIPVVFLSFPRLIDDAPYLYCKLAPVLPRPVDIATALAAHASLADPAKVRVGAEICPAAPEPAPGLVLEGPAPGRLERAALTRLLAELRGELEAVRQELTGANAMIQQTRAVAAIEADNRRAAEQALVSMTIERDRETERLLAANQALAATTAERDFRQAVWTVGEQALQEMTADRDRLAAHIETVGQAFAARIQTAEQALAAAIRERDEQRARASPGRRLHAFLLKFEASSNSSLARMMKQSLRRIPRVRSMARRALGA